MIKPDSSDKTYINPAQLMGSHGAFFAPPGGGAVMQKIF
jgi:hypothetical protein